MMMHPTRALLIAALLLGWFPGVAQAQRVDPDREALRARREARRAALAQPDSQRTARAATANPEDRLRAENRLRASLAQAVRRRLNLSDEQTSRLVDVNRRFSDERTAVTRNEFRIRRELRRAIAGGDTTRSAATAQLLDELLAVQRQRLDIQQKEQTALSEFLTPEQRARYIGMMEQLRRRIESRADSSRRGGGLE